MLLQKFGYGYYVTESYIEKGNKRVLVNDHDYRNIQSQVYETGKDYQQVVVNIDNVFFELEPSQNIPSNVISLPKEAIEKTTVKHPPEIRRVLVLEPWFLKYISGIRT